MAPPRPPSALQRATQAHAEGNALIKDGWELYAAHREQLMRVLLDAAPAQPGRVVLLGAGYCNDVDLESLGERFSTIHLVDIDADALAGARERAPAALRPRIVLHAPVDLTGLLAALDGWKGGAPSAKALEAAIAEGAAIATRGLPVGEADLVASCCVLTQLSWCLALNLGEQHPALPELRRALMVIHGRTLASLTRPGGTALVATDVISSDRYPLEDLPPDTDLAAVLDQVIVESRYYAGANPRLLGQVLRKDPVLAQAFAPARKLAPWLWPGRLERTYLVYALSLARR